MTRLTSETYDLHLWMMGAIVVLLIGVFSVMLHSTWAHRNSVGGQAEQFHANITVEIVWAIIPFLILISMAWPATKTLMNLNDTSSADITKIGRAHV